MLEILKYILSNIWIFLGFFAILNVVLYHGVRIMLGFLKYLTIVFRGWPSDEHEEEYDGENLNK